MIGVIRRRGLEITASLGLGSRTEWVGAYESGGAAEAALFARGARRIVSAREGESGWDAFGRENREQLGATIGISTDWIRMGHVVLVMASHGEPLPSERDYILFTRSMEAELERISADEHRPPDRRRSLEKTGPVAQLQQALLEGHPLASVELSGHAGSFTLRATPIGRLLLDIRHAGHMDTRALLCGACGAFTRGGPRRIAPIYGHCFDVHSACPWCGGVCYAGDSEPAPEARHPVCDIHERCQLTRCAPKPGERR
jgi:hypothetical protein